MGAFPEAARLRTTPGLPWAAVVTPWTRCLWRNDVNCDVMSDIEVMRHSRRTREVSADDIARCRECGGFINSTCIVQRLRWQCSLCAEWNPLEGARYASGVARGVGGRGTHPELHRSWGEFLVARGNSRRDVIAHVIVVDTTRQASTSGYLGATRRGLRRAVGSLPEHVGRTHRGGRESDQCVRSFLWRCNTHLADPSRLRHRRSKRHSPPLQKGLGACRRSPADPPARRPVGRPPRGRAGGHRCSRGSQR